MSMHRTLKFMTHALSLREPQVQELARILAALETERAQAAVDQRRSLGAFADAMSGEGFDQDKAKQGAEVRAQSGDRLRKAILDTLQKTHALLDTPQRQEIAHMLRTGALTI
jgi:hypothetical protein